MKPNPYFWNIETQWEKYYNPKPSQYLYSDICKDSEFDRTNSDDFVFFDEHNIGYTGLKKFSCIEKDKKPIFIVDNHHRVLSYFFEVFHKTKKPLHIIHIDAHRDDALYVLKEENRKSFAQLHKYCNGERTFSSEIQQHIKQIEESCRVCDYLDCGKQLGLIQKIDEYTQSNEYENIIIPKTPYVLNCDIDIFGEEGTAIENDLIVKTIAQFWNFSEAICIATSPGFIERKQAERIISFFVKKS